MSKRKSIAITEKAYQMAKTLGSNSLYSFVSNAILQTPIDPQLANTSINTYKSTKRKLIHISKEAWKHLKKLEYCFIFDADVDTIPLNDIASIIITQYLSAQRNHEAVI
ncbi:MAG: hypothetical protein NZ519_05150 [Bacteroidia bacterium]|nr:hypothetical protein [Bacteroidia bacterium]